MIELNISDDIVGFDRGDPRSIYDRENRDIIIKYSNLVSSLFHDLFASAFPFSIFLRGGV